MRMLLMLAVATLGIGIAGDGHAQSTPRQSAWDFSFEALDGGKIDLGAYRGKVLLVVNTASFCGFTPQYKGLQALWEKYEKRGLVVIGVPSNDFGEQEPGNASEIKTFCEGAYGITFPLAAKNTVKGSDAHPFYRWAAATLGAKAVPQWNFHKYLVGADGQLVTAFSTSVEPMDSRLTQIVERELAKVALD